MDVTALAWTHVEYPKGHILGYLLAWFSLIPIFLMVSLATLIVFRRDLHTMCYFIGILLNEISNWVIKHIIREPRPNRGPEIHTTVYGMPSAHSQFMWFFTSYLILFLCVRVHHNQRGIDNVWKYVTCGGSCCISLLVVYSRVYLGYHTPQQVLWGWLVGVLLGTAWFCIVHMLLTPLFPFVVSWPISEFLMIRDTTLIPNVLWFEYTTQRGESRNRQRKMSLRKSQ